MKFKQFLIENEPSLDEILKNIKDECSEFLNESGGYPLFRGQKFRDPSCKYETQAIRKNKDSKSYNVGLFNLYIQEKYKIKHFRNENVMFAAGEEHGSEAYGPTLFVFPVNGYQFLWSPLVRDFLGREHIIRSKIMNALRSKPYELELNKTMLIMDKVDAAIRKHYPPTIKDIALDPTMRLEDGKNAYIGFVRKVLKDVYDDLDYEMGHLKSALESGNEIMFRTKFYYGVQPAKIVDFLQLDKQSKDRETYVELFKYLRK